MPLTTSLVGVEILVEKYWVVFWKKIHLLPRKRCLRPYSKKKNMRFSRVFQSTIGRSRCRSSSNSSTSRINYIYENIHTHLSLSLSLLCWTNIYSQYTPILRWNIFIVVYWNCVVVFFLPYLPQGLLLSIYTSAACENTSEKDKYFLLRLLFALRVVYYLFGDK